MKDNKTIKLPEPTIKEEKGGYRAYFKIIRSDGSKGNTNGGIFKTAKQAKENALQRQNQSKRKFINDKEFRDKATIKDVLIKYREQLKIDRDIITGQKRSLDASDYENVNAIIEHFLYSYGDIAIDDIEEQDFREWIEYIQANRTIKNRDFSGARIHKLRTTLSKFSKYLKDNRYIDTSLYDAIKSNLKQAEIYSKNHNKNDLNKVPNYADIYALINSFKKERFEDWFMYAFLLLGFFSSMRISELMALRWNQINFNSCFISIIDSITKRENKENVYKRHSKNNHEAKNKYSVRDIPMMNIYYYVLKDYKQQYKMKFDLEYGTKEFDNAFVFPAYQNIKYKGNFGDIPVYMQYTNTQWLNRQLKRLCESHNKAEEEKPKSERHIVDYFPCRILRHAGCTHLAQYHDFLESEMVDYMGHSFRGEGSMIKQVYEKLEKIDRGYRTRNRHPELYIVNPKYELERQKEKYDMIADLIDTNEREKALVSNRSNAIGQNLDYLYKKGITSYYYTHDEEWYVNEWRFVNSDITSIKFIEEEIRPEDEIDFNAKIDLKKEMKKHQEENNCDINKQIEDDLKQQNLQKKNLKRKKK